MQAVAKQVYDHLDAWWPYDTMRPSDAEEMVASPGFADMCARWPRSFGRLGIESLAPLSRGVIRPIAGGWVEDEDLVRQSPLNLLLYVDSVVVDATLLEPAYFVRQGSPVRVEQLADSLRWLISVRPLVADGSILFADKYPRDLRLPEEISRVIDADPVMRKAILDQLPAGYGGVDSVGIALAANIDAALAERATPLAGAPWQQLAYDAFLGRRPVGNKRVSRLGALGNFRVQHPQASWADLVSLRQDSEAHHAVRQAIARGFELVEDIPDGADLRDVQAVVHDELHHSFRHLQAVSERSTFRSTFHPVIKSLGWLGLGAAGTQLLGTPVTAGPTVVSETMSSLANKKRAKAIWTVVTSFGEDPS